MQPCYLYDTMPKTDTSKNVCLIDADALRSNFSLLTSLLSGVRPICVVKADAYGHTAEICVPELLRLGCDFFAVSCVEEAASVRKLCLRDGKDADILILGYTASSHVAFLSENNIIQTVLSLSHAESLSATAQKQNCTLRVHIAVDTGMNRVGICANADDLCEAAALEAEKITKLPNISVEGIFTHFSQSDGELSETVSESGFTRLQAKRFSRVCEFLSKRGIKLFSHTCNSAATVRFPEYRFDGVRLGIMLYGVYPSSHFDDIGLMPVMSLSTVISHVHNVPVGGAVSYGGTFVAEKDTLVATLPIGYADGFLRKYTGANVSVCTQNGEYTAKIVGRICMDQCMIDVTGLDVKVGDRVVIFGQSPRGLRELASLADTIEYECLCLISARVPRVKK